MNSNIEPYDEISIAEIGAKLRSFAMNVWCDRTRVVQFMFLAVLAGFFFAFASGEEFVAKTRILPYRSGAGSANSLSGLAGLAGVRLPGGPGEQTITADLYPEVAKSLDFRLSVAETPIRFSSLGRKATTVEYFQYLRKTPLIELVEEYSFGLPSKLIAFSQAPRPSNSRVVNTQDTEGLPSYSRYYLAFVNLLEGRLSISIDKKTSIITIVGQMPDPYAAADLVHVASTRLMERIIDYESRKAGEQFRFVKEQHRQSKDRYERTQQQLASFSDRNRALMSATAQIDRDRLQREYDLAFEVFQQFSRELEQARIKMNQDTPVFTVIERVTVPAERSSPRRARIMLLCLLAGMLVGVARVGIRILLHPVV